MSNKKYLSEEELEEVVVRIQDAALHTVGNNIVPRELSAKAARAIYFRSERIQRENLTHPLDHSQKKKEMDICWKMWQEGRV